MNDFKLVLKALIFLSLLCSFSINAQVIQGTVLDNNETVPFVNIIVRNANNPELVYQFTKSNENGFYNIKLKNKLDSIYIEVTAIAYEPNKKLLKNLQQQQKLIIQDFKLHPRTTLLTEVVVSKRQPIIEKNDTITYNPNAFRDGTEKVIEDLLKKLPGIKIEDSGEIKFKGKSIKKFLLDGDDLFDNQYTIGSRNINVDLVEKVQAIENFNENELLKGLINSDEVALNIQLKKGKTDFSGNSNLSYGYQDKYDLSVTGLLISQKAKGFITTSYNNVGNNNTPYDFRSGIESVELIKEELLVAKELIRQGNFYSQVDDKYHRFNSNLFSSANILYKFSPKLTGKASLGLLDDKLTRDNVSHSEYLVLNDTIKINEAETIIKKPRLYNGSFFIENKASKKLTWDYTGKLTYQQIDFKSSSINDNIAQKNNLLSSNFFTKHNFNLTKRINVNSAYLINAIYGKSRAPQIFNLTPGIRIEENPIETILENNQASRFDKETFKVRFDYYRSFNDLKWNIATDYISVKNKLFSDLKFINENNEIISKSIFQNNLIYNYNAPSLFTSLNYFKKNKYGFLIASKIQYYNFLLDDVIRDSYKEEKELVFSPLIKFVFSLNKNSSLLLSYSFNQVVPSESTLFEGVVLTGYRSFRNNEPNFSFLKTHTYELDYNFRNLFKFTTISAGLTFNDRRNNFFNKTSINQEITINTFFLLPTGNKDFTLNLNGEQYFHFIRTTARFNSNYTLSFDKNIVNNSEFRDIESKTLFLGLTLRPGLKGNWKVENRMDFFNTAYYLEEKKQNSLSSLVNNFKVMYKIKDYFLVQTTLQFLNPNVAQNDHYWFWDADIKWSSKNKQIDYSIIARNLTNNSRFESISISDFSKTTSSHNLLERFILANVSFKF